MGESRRSVKKLYQQTLQRIKAEDWYAAAALIPSNYRISEKDSIVASNLLIEKLHDLGNDFVSHYHFDNLHAYFVRFINDFDALNEILGLIHLSAYERGQTRSALFGKKQIPIEDFRSLLSLEAKMHKVPSGVDILINRDDFTREDLEFLFKIGRGAKDSTVASTLVHSKHFNDATDLNEILETNPLYVLDSEHVTSEQVGRFLTDSKENFAVRQFALQNKKAPLKDSISFISERAEHFKHLNQELLRVRDSIDSFLYEEVSQTLKLVDSKVYDFLMISGVPEEALKVLSFDMRLNLL